MANGSITRRQLLRTGAVAGAAAGVGLARAKSSVYSAPAVLQGGPVTIRFMTHNTLEQAAGAVLKQMIAEFEEQNPDIKIQLEEVPNADILTKLTAYAEGNDLPDVIDGQFGLASFINLNAALDITDRVDAEGLRESFIPVALQAGTDGTGRILGLPFYTGTDALYYRTDHFQEAGLDPAAPPKTWQELADTAKKLTNPRAGRYGFGMYGKTHTVRCIHFMQNNGPDGEMLRLNRETGIWTILVNSPESIGAIEFMVSLAREHQVVPPNVVEMDYPANVAAFSGGNISMLTTGPWGAQTFITTNPEIEGKFAVAPHPTPTGETPVLRQGSLIYAIGRTTKYPDQAFKFLKWFTHDRQPYFAANAKYGPTTKAALEDPAIRDDPFLAVFLEQSLKAVVEPYEVELGDWNKLKDQFDPEWQAALIGDRDVPTALNTAATRFKEILGDRGELKYPVT
ncbi:MAG: multiple sugar transport system substrate-binding protein [Thermomicrobiales bacterium]|nr:multiple sugar transport system substrate-binding protein [Thermomicrobiales bacterium]MEA2527264.1 multiple sugar transport system substrate-binding protein [Thermomicrobiales bacterium]MEA2530089.1 multiple sugar transport system substrate-binding protein [Thermomicrobiales bacterium]MEA2585738.1 multiple sugar transport system substrate-binding protein [Thermomicrobiales bacterium]MEA2596874.1 multiple sugar transport system substrate-binding protein [Thermomicrobiales bacterium]